MVMEMNKLLERKKYDLIDLFLLQKWSHSLDKDSRIEKTNGCKDRGAATFGGTSKITNLKVSHIIVLRFVFEKL